ncbi:adenosine 3'-phospho 5'-phosphosulfate transporter 1 [Tribolium castaneum]|nr:PREDICTED: adenosine 3'-phospho 5'-phosphosulfate transporter 1 [Tribolium castaneum]|eukprot:XP_008200160.1 PREDICTED: adenosine 3'-phospho 5'-phosphosulfate transporter 1 [Tribolium castaneum]
MATSAPFKIAFIVLSSVTALCLLNKALSASSLVQQTPEEYSWLVHGLMNILGYATLFIPGYLTYKYVRKTNYINRGGDGWCFRGIQTCFGEDESSASGTAPTVIQRSTSQEIISIMFHFFGLQVSYLTWGVLQEKVMTQKYQSGAETEYFKDSQFLVFVNRVLAFCMSGVYIFCTKQTRHRCPLYKYAFCSFSNIMSSWCQYEALKYVSFPHQVLAKAAKTIPVMLMGRIISKTKYEYYEYVTSVILSVGMLMFMLDVGNDRADSAITTLSGAFLLILYIVFDSFTSNWQQALFKSYKIKPVQMMCCVNLFSCVFTAVSLLQQDVFFKSFHFMLKYPQFVVDCLLLSVCSAAGQLFIFSTIAKFGPLIFAIITTIRQGLSVLLSCIIYNHHVTIAGVFGITLVFTSVLLRIYCGHRLKSLRKSANAPQKIAV